MSFKMPNSQGISVLMPGTFRLLNFLGGNPHIPIGTLMLELLFRATIADELGFQLISR